MVYTYKCFKIKQRQNSDFVFLSFVAIAKDVYNWSHADNIEIDKNGIQRMLEKSKWDKITKFFNTHQDNIIPNNVILAFDDEVSEVKELYNADEVIDNRSDGYILRVTTDSDIVELIIDDAIKNNTYIIDGQHRLKGMAEVDEDLPVIVSLFINIDKLNRAFQFLTINNKASKVKTDNIKALISNFDKIENTLKDRLATASISAGKFSTSIDIVNSDSESPFYQLIDWVNNRTGKKIVSTVAIENSLKIIQKTFPELIEDNNENKTLALDILYNIWRPVVDIYKIQLNNVEKYVNLFKKANIQAITEYICLKLSDEIVFATDEIDITKPDSPLKYMSGLLNGIPEEFWTTPWKLTGLDSQTGRHTIIKEIIKMKRNINSGKDWFEDLELYKDDA
ncbi:DGQHR domain-containing protein [Aliarcobacter vitoriensis]|uniref:DGQHR domain-containing protein n=1 Tax=Aliarcobacter vitoriensis TaxID=2011099 RepID=UPI003AADF3B5